MLDPLYLEFIAQNECINIVPNFTEDKWRLYSQTVGPFEAGNELSVPIWVAINLRNCKKCRIIPPEWLNMEDLLKAIDNERNSDLLLKPPHLYYQEIAHLLFKNASNDISNAGELVVAVKDLNDVRLTKLKNSAYYLIENRESYANIDYITPMEINTIRGSICTVMNFSQKLKQEINQFKHLYQPELNDR